MCKEAGEGEGRVVSNTFMEPAEEAPASNPVEDDSWWGRPAGGREVLGIAAPMIISSLSWTVMTFIDRVFLNHVSGAAMAAAFASSVVWFSALSLPLGVTMYVGTFVSQYFGKGATSESAPRCGRASSSR